MIHALLKQSTQVTITILMVDSADHVTGKTGLAAGLTITASKAGTYSSTPITPTVTELDATNAKGLYSLILTTGHTNTLGELLLHITASGADPADYWFQVSTYIPGEAATLQADQAVNATKFAGQTITAAAGVTLPSSVASPTNITAATGVVLSAAGVQAIWDALTSALTTVGSIGKRLVDNLTGDIYARLGAPAGASVSADVAAVKAVLPSALGANGNIKADVRDYNGAAGTFASGRPEVNTTHWKGTAAAAVDTAGYPVVTVKDGTGQGEIATTGGAIDMVTALTNAPSDSSGVTTLLSRLSATRAGYLDNLSAGAVALEASVQSVLSKLLKYVQLILRKDSAITTDNATEVTAINANGGSGAGAFDNTTDAQEALRDRGDAAWTTVAASAIRSAVGLGSANLDTQLSALQADTDDIQTRLPAALVSGRMDSSIGAVASGAIAAASFAANALDAVWSTATRLLTGGTNIVLAKGVGVTGFNDLDAAGVRTAVGLGSANLDTQLAAIDSDVQASAQPGDAMALTSGERNSVADAYLDRLDAIETGLTPRGSLRLVAAAAAGDIAGGAGTIKNAVAASKTRITFSGNGTDRTVTGTDVT